MCEKRELFAALLKEELGLLGGHQMIYSFEDYELDPTQYELRKDGRVCAIEPKAFDLLHFLVRNRDRLVTKDEIHETIWQGRIVSEATVDSCINATRRAVGDNGKDQRLIKTLPRRGFRFVGDVNETTEDSSKDVSAGMSAEGISSDLPSIAVLPFENMSGDAAQEFFSDGVTENIITALSRFRWLVVIARSSSFSFRGQSKTARQIAQELNVRYVLDGSVRRSDERVRITAQLIDAANDKHIWAEHYDGQLEDIFDLQDDIAHQISACLEPEIERAEWRGLSAVHTPSLSSWDQYLRGLAHMHEYTRDGNIAAKTYFLKAIELEREFAHAHACLAYVMFHDIADGYVQQRTEAMEEAENHARAAVTIDDQDAFAHCVLGRLYSIQGRFDDAISELQASIRLNPSLALAHHGLAFALYYSGEAERSIPLFEAAEQLSPHDHNVWAFLGIRAMAHIQLGDYTAAVRDARQAVRKPHAKYWANVSLVSALGHANMIADAKLALEELMRRKPEISVRFVLETLSWSDQAQMDHFVAGLRNAGLPE